MKKKQLELLLQKIPPPINPKPHLEQYMTPATIASDIIYLAHQFNDITDRTVLDLGCGTGIFAFGAAIVGAKKIIGIDIDKDVISIAKKHATENKYHIDFFVQNIENVNITCNTVIMNPPFGAQKANKKADRKFIEKAAELSDVFYSLHLSETIPFIKKLLSALNAEITFHKEYSFPIKWMHTFHKKEVKKYHVSLIRGLKTSS